MAEIAKVSPNYRYYHPLEIESMEGSLVQYMETKAVVRDAKTGFIFCREINHQVTPAIIRDAAKVISSKFLKILPPELQPTMVTGAPNRGREFATALALETDLPICVSERLDMKYNGNEEFGIEYDESEDMVILKGIPSFTKPGMVGTHTIRGLKPGDRILIADDFSALGIVTDFYLRGLSQLGITPVFAYVAAKDFPDLDPPQTGYRKNKLAGMPVFATVRITEMIGGTGGRVKATSEDIRA